MRQLRTRVATFLAVAATLLAWCSGAQAQNLDPDPLSPVTAEEDPDGEDGEEPLLAVEFDLKSGYIDEVDLLRFTPTPVIQPSVTLNATEHLSINIWGSHALDPHDKRGQEIDLTANYQFDLGPKTNVSLTAGRYLLLEPGVPDVTVVSATVTHGPVDVLVKKYMVDGPAEDATRVQVGYTGSIDKFDLRGFVSYEQGFGLADIVSVGTSVSYRLSEKVSLNATGAIPLSKGDAHPGKAFITFGIKFAF